MPVRISNTGSTRKSLGRERGDLSSTIQSSCQAMKKSLITLVETLEDDNIIDENDSDLVNKIVERAEKIAVLEHFNGLMKTHIDSELLNVRKDQEEVRTNNQAVDDEIRKLQQEAAADEAYTEALTGRRKRGFDASAAKKVVKKIKDLTEQGAQKFSTGSNDFVKQIKEAVGAGGEDNDVVIQGGKGLCEQDTRCPYSTLVFTDPCSNCSKKPCNHHMDRASVNDSAKGKGKNWEFNCAVPGCDGKWSLATSTSDAAFLRKVQKFLRRKEEAGGLTDSAKKRKKNSLVVDDEDEDEAEYTMM